MTAIIENGYCIDCEMPRSGAGACPVSDDHTHDFTWNGCNVCDGGHWIVNDVDDTGPWRFCPECNASGNIANPFVFVEARHDK